MFFNLLKFGTINIESLAFTMRSKIWELQDQIELAFQQCLSDPHKESGTLCCLEDTQRLRDAILEYKDELDAVLSKL